jgi:hypothetical protein
MHNWYYGAVRRTAYDLYAHDICSIDGLLLRKVFSGLGLEGMMLGLRGK